MLLNHGALVNHCDTTGKSPIMLAAANGHAAAVGEFFFITARGDFFNIHVLQCLYIKKSFIHRLYIKYMQIKLKAEHRSQISTVTRLY